VTIERTEVLWLEARADYTLQEIVEMSGLPRSIVVELCECGALPAAPASCAGYEAESVVLARAARRLRDAFELENDGLAVAVSLLRRVRLLERQLADAGIR
jgi:chaperone modulatory protein CbpM